MKKILFLLAFIVAFVAVNAQVATLNLTNKYDYTYTGTSSDVIVDSLGTLTKVFYVDAKAPYYATVQVTIDSVTAKQKGTFALFGSMDGVKLETLGTGSSHAYLYTGASSLKFLISNGTSTYNIVTPTYTTTGTTDTTVIPSVTQTVAYTLPLKYRYLIFKATSGNTGDIALKYLYIRLNEQE